MDTAYKHGDLMLYIILAILLLFLIFLAYIVRQNEPIKYDRKAYNYSRKLRIMTQSEQRLFVLLQNNLPNYNIFPQVHLSSIFDHKVKGQNWKGALSHIQRKSVDFVICSKDKNTLVLALELDDWSHGLEQRKARDAEVERIFTSTDLPLVRISSKDAVDDKKVLDILKKVGIN